MHGCSFSYCLLEIRTNMILLGLVQSFEEFKTVLYQTRPVEFLYDQSNIRFELIEILK